jgi:glycosyltransferase involved in cell wall biosynthesis
VSLVSAIIPTYNRSHTLERAIRSILFQTFSDIELIVVDDCSTDGTELLLGKFPSVRTLRHGINRGVSAARNTGIRAASGRLIAFLDSDDEWLPNKIAEQLKLFSHLEPLFICHTDEIWMRNDKRLNPGKVHIKQGGFFFERALERCLISPSAVIISRDLIEEVGLFDENLPAAEDYDLWLRITSRFAVNYVPERLVIKHGGGDDQLSFTTPAIDKLRIRAILKIINDAYLSDEYREAAIRELIKKCRIVAQGATKRGFHQEAQRYIELIGKYENFAN